MKRIFFLVSLTALIIASCNSDKSNNIRKNHITKVCFATGGCFGPCPFLAFEIDSSLNYKFFGGKYSTTTGFFKGRVSQEFWDTLNIKFEHINYKQLDTLYEHSIDDLSIETILHFDNKQKHIYAQSASLPDSIMTVFSWLMKSCKNIALIKITDGDTLFETKIQNPLLMPPPPPPPMKPF